MKASKTYKIGEYAVGGIIVAEVTNKSISIINKQWDNSTGYSKKSSQANAKELSRLTLKVDESNTRWKADTYLNMLTSSYYSDEILKWIESKTELN